MKQPQKILVLDDDENDYLLIEDMLRQTYGADLSIDWAKGGSTATGLIKSGSYDVCLVDHYLGDGINGLQWAQSMISSLKLECPPLIMLTGVKPCENLDLSASESGIAGFIVKSELTARHLEHSIRYAMQTRRMLRESLHSEARFHLFFDHAYEGIMLLDQHGKVLQANRSAELMFCYEKGTMQGLHMHQLISKFSLDYDLLNNQVAARETPPTMERMIGKDQRGNTLDLEVATNMAMINNVIFYSVSLIDIRHHLALQEELAALAHIDPLTGLINRRYFRMLADQEFSRAARTHHQLFMMMLDIDHFKLVNDAHGHDVGDQALVAVAAVLKNGVRSMDILARWGGEEFLVLLPETDLAGATLIAERIRQQVSQIKLPKIQEGLTISIGMCEAKPGMELKISISLADQALYQAKASGRNRVVCHQ
ncbi:MAG: diguanylate cyclase [Nitrosomonadales bacterium]|nr:diguanylate cyclase [Nitrosomonadales bacterium]